MCRKSKVPWSFTLTDRTEVGRGSFLKISFAKNWMKCPDLTKKKKKNHVQNPTLIVWWRGQFTNCFFLEITLKCSKLYIKLMFGNITSMEQGEGAEVQIQEKPPWWSFSGMSKTTQIICFLFPHLCRAFCWKLHEILRAPKKLNVWQPPPPMGEGIWLYC